MAETSMIDWVALILVVIGALNWGLYGIAGMNIVQLLLGSIPILAQIVYILIALSGIWMVYSAIAKK